MTGRGTWLCSGSCWLVRVQVHRAWQGPCQTWTCGVCDLLSCRLFPSTFGSFPRRWAAVPGNFLDVVWSLSGTGSYRGKMAQVMFSLWDHFSLGSLPISPSSPHPRHQEFTCRVQVRSENDPPKENLLTAFWGEHPPRIDRLLDKEWKSTISNVRNLKGFLIATSKYTPKR